MDDAAPFEVTRHDRQPDGRALEQLVRRRQSLIGCSGLVDHHADVRGGDPNSEVVRRDRRQDVDAVCARGLGSQRDETLLERAEAHEDQVRSLQAGTAHRVHQLFQAAVGREPAVVQDDVRRWREGSVSRKPIEVGRPGGVQRSGALWTTTMRSMPSRRRRIDARVWFTVTSATTDRPSRCSRRAMMRFAQDGRPALVPDSRKYSWLS